MIENKKWICYKIITGHANGYTEIRNSARCGESEETKIASVKEKPNHRK